MKIEERLEKYLGEQSSDAVEYKLKRMDTNKWKANFWIGEYPFWVIFLVPIDVDKDLDVEQKNYWDLRLDATPDIGKALKKIENIEKYVNTVQKVTKDFIKQVQPEKMRLNVEKKIEKKYEVLSSIIKKVNKLNIESEEKDGNKKVYFVKIK